MKRAPHGHYMHFISTNVCFYFIIPSNIHVSRRNTVNTYRHRAVCNCLYYAESTKHAPCHHMSLPKKKKNSIFSAALLSHMLVCSCVCVCLSDSSSLQCFTRSSAPTAILRVWWASATAASNVIITSSVRTASGGGMPVVPIATSTKWRSTRHG